MRCIAVCSLFLFLPLAIVARAQEHASVVGSTVSGHVLCGDSNTPARFAKILLKPTTPEHPGNAFARSAAKAIPITQGEERVGVDVTVRAHALHNLVGHVHAKSDDHALNLDTVTLTAASDPSLHLQAAVRDDGGFHFEDLPEDTTYTLKVANAADAVYTAEPASLFGLTMPKSKVTQAYQTATQDVTLGGKDNTEVRFSLAPMGKSAELHDAPPE